MTATTANATAASFAKAKDAQHCTQSRTATLSCLAKNAGVTDASLIGTAGHLTIQRSRPQKWQTYSGVDRSRDLGAAPLNWNSAMELLESHFIVDYFVGFIDFLEAQSDFDRLCIQKTD